MKCLRKHGYYREAKALEYVMVGFFRDPTEEDEPHIKCCKRCAKGKLATRFHKAYECDDNRNIAAEVFKKTQWVVRRAKTEAKDHVVLWYRGLIPANLLEQPGEVEVYEAQIWKTANFDTVLHQSKMGFSDGTSGQDDVPAMLRPAGFGAATFNFRVVDNMPVIENIQGICGQVPGEQTVPRAEVWAAVVLISRIHPNAVGRIGIDAAYVVDGVAKRARLEKGKNGDLWSLFFALLDLRTAELGIAKVWSHIEGVADLAIKAGEAQLCDIIGNALADEAAAIAAKLLRPTPTACKTRESIHRLAFNICIRLAFSQAREWELLDDTRIYEAPPEVIDTDTTFGTAFQKTTD